MRSVIRIIATLLACMMLVLGLAACGTKGKTLMTLNKSEMSVNMFQFYLSRMKGRLCVAGQYGSSATQAAFWDKMYDSKKLLTYNEFHTNETLEAAKVHLAVEELFRERGLKVSDSKLKEIDARLDEYILNDADGSKATFNAILKDYGINYDILRDIYILEAKMELLEKDLFGDNGSDISAKDVEEYFLDNYVRFKQVFLCSYEYVYITDENGDVIYYKDANTISYDTEKGTAKKNSDGTYASDVNGHIIYVYTDDKGKERISYKPGGASAQKVMDSSGEPIVKYYNDEEMEVLTEEAQSIMEKAVKGDTVGFDALVTKYSEDSASNTYPDGIYISQSDRYDSPEVVKAVFGMAVGDIKMVKSDYGIHILMRYETEEGAYRDEAYEDLFTDTKTGTYVFMDALVGELFEARLQPYVDKVVVDKDVLATADIKRAGINYYY